MFSLNLFPRESGKAAVEEPSSAQPASHGSSSGETAKKLISAHKGKLAIGAAAMLGLAIFYRWRESRLAKENPRQYAHLKRIKSAIAAEASFSEAEAAQK